VLAKTTRPTSVTAITRPRLFKRLDPLQRRPVIWVWAPPGAGKTILIASYIASRKRNHLWFQVDEGDSDLSSFFYFLGLAAPKRRRPMPLLTPEYRQNVAIFTRNFFRELFNRLRTPFTLVFDNYQEVPIESALNEMMPLALAELPKEGRAIFLSRNEPPPSFAKLRADQALELLQYSELRFTEQEATKLIRKLSPGQLSRDDISDLCKYADGWAAALVLSLGQTRHQSEKPTPSSESSEVLFDYFAGEVFKRADIQTQEVLCQAAFFPKITTSMAVQQSGCPAAGQIIARLHRQDLFTTKLPGASPSYEFHPLFRDFLLVQASKLFSPEQVNDIRVRSARVLQKAGQVEAAAPLLRDSEAWPELTELICKQAPVLIAQCRVETVDQWIRGIPDAWVDDTPWLLLWRGASRFMSWPDDCCRDCEKALAAFRKRRDAAGVYLAWSIIINAYEFNAAQEQLGHWIGVFDELRLEFPNFPSLEVEMRVAQAAAESLACIQPLHHEVEYWINRAVELSQQQGDLLLQAMSAFTWWRYYWESGDHLKAGLIVDSMIRLLEDDRVPPAISIVAGFTVAAQQYLRADPDCRQTITELLRKGSELGVPYSLKNLLHTVGLASALSDGDTAIAKNWLQEDKEGLRSVVPAQRFQSLWTVVWYGLQCGHIDQLRVLLFDLFDVKDNLRGSFWEWLAEVLIAKIYHRLGEPAKTEIHLDKALTLAGYRRSPYMEFTTRLAQAEIYFDKGREPEGVEMLRIAMALGKAGNYVTSEIWIPAVMAKLCARALEVGIEVDYVRMLVRKRNLVPEEPPLDIEAWPWPIQIYTLGQFEVLKDDQPLRFAHKVQRKPLALLKTIIALGAQKVREEILLDTLWPDSDGDAARFALNSALHRLRTLLGHEETIIRRDNEVTLNTRRCWLDFVAVERLLEKAEAILDHDEKTVTAKIDLINRAAKFYQGPFLGDDPESSLGNRRSDRLRRRLVRLLIRVGQHWESLERLPDAIQSYEEALRIDPCAEDICRQLMTAYHRLGRPSEVSTTYRSCRQALETYVGTHPSAETDRLLTVLLGK
jgi:DNA-binding SARP family transcriptional activator